MKNKLKMLFAYFRPLGNDVRSYLTLDYNRIEDWDAAFEIDNKKTINPPKVIIDIIEELVDLYENDFDSYNSYDVDSFWYLDIIIEPKLNRLTFRSQCKIEKYDTKSSEKNLKDYPSLPELLNQVQEKYGDFTKIYLLIEGNWDNTNLTYVTVDNYDDYEPESDLFLEIGDKIMEKNFGNHWSSEQGMEGEITIWGDDIFVDAKDLYEDYEDTEMNLIITPQNIIE